MKTTAKRPVIPYAAGKVRKAKFLEVARELLIEDGIEALTLRGVARAAGTRMGLVTYYFPTKKALLRATLEDAVKKSDQHARGIFSAAGETTEAKLRSVIQFLLQQTQGRSTTNLMMDIWAGANRDAFIRSVESSVYEPGLDMICDLLQQLHPALPAKKKRLFALYMTSAIVGVMVFSGAKRQWEGQRNELHKLVMDSIVNTLSDLSKTSSSRRKN